MSTSEQSIAATDLMAGLDFNLPAGFELIASDRSLAPRFLPHWRGLKSGLPRLSATPISSPMLPPDTYCSPVESACVPS